MKETEQQQAHSLPRIKRVNSLLKDAFPEAEIKITDESKRHAKHIGRMDKEGSAGEGQETHFFIEIKSHFFDGKSRIDRQRFIHDLLKEEFSSGLHSLRLSLKDSIDR